MASIRKRNDKYQVQIRRKGFPPVSRCFRNLKDAKEWSRHMETLADRKDLPVDTKVLDSLTLGDLIRRYRDEIVPAKRGAEIETVILNSFPKTADKQSPSFRDHHRRLCRLQGQAPRRDQTDIAETPAFSDVPPGFRTVLNWNFPFMIPAMGEGEFHEEVKVFGGADRFHSAPGG